MTAAANSEILTRTALSDHTLYASWLQGLSDVGGVALLDKGKDWTSFDVVAKLRGITRIKKVGHAGTLDPLATGLLIVCFGKKTKSINDFQEQTKTYRAVVKLGATTKTDDAEAEEEYITSVNTLTSEQVRGVLTNFLGEIEQIPPMFSAIKKNGVPLYKMARKGQEIEREARRVRIDAIEVESLALPYCTLAITCSKGTYIRSLARDIGAMLGVGGYLADLRRTRIGAYSAQDALMVEEISQLHASMQK
ncbi:MAG: tRNA pseudouridine(55) synthase TruB [Candidatus Kapaibacteriota bacterium]|jgi:tRNA pseudouridine55 synthase